MRRTLTVSALTVALLVALAAPALACGGLIASLKKGHVEVLRKATTLAAWHKGMEHYITGFTFAGNADSFGYLIPLPGNPDKIEKGGDWTLERLQREVAPQAEFAATAERGSVAHDSMAVQIHQRAKIDALDITILSGGGQAIVKWANDNGFGLDPDSGEKFAHYSRQGAFFAAAKYNKLRVAREGLEEGQGTVIHFTIPTPGPWIPLRILALGKGQTEIVNADLFVLTDGRPSFVPALDRIGGMRVVRQEEASEQLLIDLRGDKGMEWVPDSMYLTALALEAPAVTVDYDLSIDGGRPVGAPVPVPIPEEPFSGAWLRWLAIAALAALTVGALRRGRPQPKPA